MNKAKKIKINRTKKGEDEITLECRKYGAETKVGFNFLKTEIQEFYFRNIKKVDGVYFYDKYY